MPAGRVPEDKSGIMQEQLKALGRRIWEQGDVAALSELEPLVRASPGVVPGHRLLVNGALKLGQPQRAARALARFARHHPDDPDLPRMSLYLEQLQTRVATAREQAVVALKQGNLQDALPFFDEVRVADTADPGPLNIYALALRRAGETDRLALLLTWVEALAQETAEARHCQLAGNVASHLEHADRAAGWYRRAVERDPAQVPGWQRLADLELQAGRPEAAAALLADLPDALGDNAVLALLRVKALQQAGQGMAARRLLMAQPLSAQGIAWHVALARLARDGFDQAGVRDACAAALCADPNQPETLELQALARVLGCDPDRAWADALAANALRRLPGGGQRLRPRQGIVGGLANEMRLDPEATERLRRAMAAADPAAALAAEVHACNQTGHAQTVAGLALLGAMRRQELLGLKPVKTPISEPDSGSDMGEIPARIWLYHEQAELPAETAAAIAELRKAAPWAEVVLLDLRSALALLREHAPKHALRAWQLCRQPGEREDLLRLVLMATRGGIWLSPKTRIHGDLRDLLTPGAHLVMAQEDTGAPGSGFVAAAPEQALMRAILADVSAEMIAGASEFIWLRTGPGAMARGLAAAIADQTAGAGEVALPDGVHLLSPAAARQVLSRTG